MLCTRIGNIRCHIKQVISNLYNQILIQYKSISYIKTEETLRYTLEIKAYEEKISRKALVSIIQLHIYP